MEIGFKNVIEVQPNGKVVCRLIEVGNDAGVAVDHKSQYSGKLFQNFGEAITDTYQNIIKTFSFFKDKMNNSLIFKVDLDIIKGNLKSLKRNLVGTSHYDFFEKLLENFENKVNGKSGIKSIELNGIVSDFQEYINDNKLIFGQK